MNVTQLAVENDFKNGQACLVEEAVQRDSQLYEEIVYGGALCNDASINPENPNTVLGDPTEGAFIFLEEKFGENQAFLKEKYPRIFEQPFDSIRKRMTTVHQINGQNIAYVKGAVDEMLPLCTKILTAEGERDLTEKILTALKQSITLCLNKHFAFLDSLNVSFKLNRKPMLKTISPLLA